MTSALRIVMLMFVCVKFPQIQALAKRFMVRDESFTLEVLQEAWLRIMDGKADGYDPAKATLNMYVNGLLRKIGLELLRKNYGSLAIPESFDAADGGQTPEDEVSVCDDIELVHEALSQVSPWDVMLISGSRILVGKSGERAEASVYSERFAAMRRFTAAIAHCRHMRVEKARGRGKPGAAGTAI